MRSSRVRTFLFSIFLISSIFVIIIDCSACKKKYRDNVNNLNQTKNFKNLSGSTLEEAVVDEIAERSKINLQIHLRHLGISKITKNMLRNITSIHSIDFQCNEIKEIEDGSFSTNEKLEKIDLMENHLTKITKHIFSGDFHELHEINLSFNEITVIESRSFDRFINLVSIDISSNCITHLHSDLFKKCSELSRVYLSNNGIIEIGSSLFKMKLALDILDLSYNNLEFIPKFKIKSIKHLDMSHNNITKLDLNYKSSHERKKLAHVEELSVAYNSIAKCVKMSEMRNDIIRLDMSHNQINDLNDFPILLKLEVLELSHNYISGLSVYEFHQHFPSLKALNISANKIDCEEYSIMRSGSFGIAIFIDRNCSSISSTTSMVSFDIQQRTMDLVETNNNEILRQLKLNRNFLIILSALFAVFIIIPVIFVLYNHLRYGTIKYVKDDGLIEQIEL